MESPDFTELFIIKPNKAMKTEVIFTYWAGNNPHTGGSIYRDVTNEDVKEYCGKYWEELTTEEKQEIKNSFT